MTRSFWLIGAAIFSVTLHPLAIAAQIGDVVPESALSGPVHPVRPGDDLVTAYIRALQVVLPHHGYQTGPASGLLDGATKRAILAYQRDAGLPSGARNPQILKETLDHVTYAQPPVYATGSSSAPPVANSGPTPLEALPPPLPQGPPTTMSPPSAINRATRLEAPPPPLPDSPPATMSPPSAINRATPIAPPAAAGDDQVRLVQQELKAKGYDIPVDGILDQSTVNAIKAFQGSNAMPRSGTIDDALLEKLKQ